MIACAITRLVLLDGSEEELPTEGVTVIVGPNNAGKTVLVREIERLLSHPPDANSERLILRDLALDTVGTFEDLMEWLNERGMPAREVLPRYRGEKFIGNVDQGGLTASEAKGIWANANQGRLGKLRNFLVSTLTPENRLQMLGETGVHNLEREVPTSPLQHVFAERTLEERLSALMRQAFGFDASLNRYNQGQLALRRGRPSIPDSPPPASPELLAAYSALPTLRQEGHGVQAFAGLLLHTIVTPAEVVLIDEPEAFLHPPQARLIGRVLVSQALSTTQLIIATHSSHVLQGLLDGSERPVKVIRLSVDTTQRRKVWPVDSGVVRDLWRDPLLRYSDLTSGMFHRGTVICEGDSDCRFYAASLDFHLHGQMEPDLLFAHVGGKARLDKALDCLRRLGVPSAIIADLDLLNDSAIVRRCVEAGGGSYDETIRSHLKQVQDAIRLNAAYPRWEAVRVAVSRFNSLPSSGHLDDKAIDVIQKALGRSTGWNTVKAAGKAGVANPEAYKSLEYLLGHLADLGIFLVPVGELERWFPHLPKAGWCGAVLEQGLHENPTPELQRFIAAVAQYFDSGVY